MQTLSSVNELNRAEHSASASEQPVRRWNLGLRHIEHQLNTYQTWTHVNVG